MADTASAAQGGQKMPPAPEAAEHEDGRTCSQQPLFPVAEADELAAFSRALAAWAYETAFIPVGSKSQNKDGTERTLAEALNGGDAERLSPWWTSLLYERHPAMTPFLYALYCDVGKAHTDFMAKLRTAPRATADRPQSIPTWGQQTTTQPCDTASPLHSWHYNLRQHLRAAEHIFWQSIAEWGMSFVRRLHAAAQPCCALLRFVHWLWTIRRLLPPVQLAPWRPPASYIPSERTTAAPRAVTVAAYFPACDAEAAAQGHFRSRYWEALHSLLDVPPAQAAPDGLTAGGLHWLFIRMRTPEASLRQHLALRDRFRAAAPAGVTLHFMEEFLPWHAIGRALGRFLRMMLASWRAEAAFRRACTLRGPQDEQRSANFYPLARVAYAASFRGWRGLERCLLDEAVREFSAQAGPQRLALFPQENCPWERLLTHALRRHGAQAGPVIGAQHSTVRPADFRYVDDARTFTEASCRRFQPDVLALNGEHARALLLAAGLPPQHLRDVEALRYQPCPQNHSVQGQARARTAPPSAKTTPASGRITSPAHGFQPSASLFAAAPPPPRHLLVLTGFFAPETVFHLRLLADCFRAGCLEGWDITVKGHPWHNPRPAARRHCPPALFARLSFSTAPLPQLFARRPALVWTSNSTTAAVDAAYAGLPLLVTAPQGTFDMCPLSALKSLPRAATVPQAAAALTAPCAVALPPHWLRRECGLRRWQTLLAECLPPR